jgi:hypothetical protein
MFKSYVQIGLLVAFFSSIIGVSYTKMYYEFLFDFSFNLQVLKIPFIFLALSLLIAGLSWFFNRYIPKSGTLIFNVLLSTVALISILLPVFYTPNFSKEVEMPEMFISFVLPLHFIVPLFWLTFSSHFIKSQA